MEAEVARGGGISGGRMTRDQVGNGSSSGVAGGIRSGDVEWSDVQVAGWPEVEAASTVRWQEAEVVSVA